MYDEDLSYHPEEYRCRNTFYGNEISQYGRECGFVDYETFSKAFSHIFADEFMSKTRQLDCWVQINGGIDYDEELDVLYEQKEDLEERLASFGEEDADDDFDPEEAEQQIQDLLTQIEAMEIAMGDDHIYHFYIVDENGACLIRECTYDPLFYSEYLDLYVWGITHNSMGWDKTLTYIPCSKAP